MMRRNSARINDSVNSTRADLQVKSFVGFTGCHDIDFCFHLVVYRLGPCGSV